MAVEGGAIGIGTGVGLKLGDKLLGNSPTPPPKGEGKGGGKKMHYVDWAAALRRRRSTSEIRPPPGDPVEPPVDSLVLLAVSLDARQQGPPFVLVGSSHP